MKPYAMRAGLLQRRFLAPILELLRQGITPEKVALSIALGITLGVTPVLGSTSVLCLVAALLFRLNVPAIQLVNYAVYPLQLALLIPLMRLGEWMFGAQPRKITLAELIAMMRLHPWLAAQAFWLATLYALAAWLVVGALASVTIYLVLTPVLRRLVPARVSQPIRGGAKHLRSRYR